MKKIGTTNDGGILFEMSKSDVLDLVTVGTKLTQLFFGADVVIPPNGAAIAQEPVAVTEDRGRPRPAAHKKSEKVKPPVVRRRVMKTAGDTRPMIKCKTCGKSFPRIRKDQTCCSKECRNKVKYPPKPTTPAPKLTTVRTVDDKTRLDVLREADRRVMARIDPVDPVEN